MRNFIHELFNPHCEKCEDKRQDSKVCSSCETLRAQLEIANYERRQLLDRLLEKPTIEIPSQPTVVSKPMMLPWNVRKQMLEREDREKARLMKDAPRPIPTEELEKELDVATATREAESRS